MVTTGEDAPRETAEHRATAWAEKRSKAARMGEVVARGATAIEHDRAAELAGSLTTELETVRTGLDDARRLAGPEIGTAPG